MSSNVVGTVKWFNEKKGLSYFEKNSIPDTSTSYSAIANPDLEALTESQKVEFVETQSPKGPQTEQIAAGRFHENSSKQSLLVYRANRSKQRP